MNEEEKIKSALLRTLIALVLCAGCILAKFVFRDENFVKEVYNYLATDIVFFG